QVRVRIDHSGQHGGGREVDHGRAGGDRRGPRVAHGRDAVPAHDDHLVVARPGPTARGGRARPCPRPPGPRPPPPPPPPPPPAPAPASSTANAHPPTPCRMDTSTGAEFMPGPAP